MDTYNVNITVEDSLTDCSCFRNTEKKSLTVTRTSETICLQENYILNIVSASENMFTVLIQNGTQVIVRNIYTTFATELCLPSNCKKHLLCIFRKYSCKVTVFLSENFIYELR